MITVRKLFRHFDEKYSFQQMRAFPFKPLEAGNITFRMILFLHNDTP